MRPEDVKEPDTGQIVHYLHDADAPPLAAVVVRRASLMPALRVFDGWGTSDQFVPAAAHESDPDLMPHSARWRWPHPDPQQGG
jgi:hypothetical protein